MYCFDFFLTGAEENAIAIFKKMSISSSKTSKIILSEIPKNNDIAPPRAYSIELNSYVGLSTTVLVSIDFKYSILPNRTP